MEACTHVHPALPFVTWGPVIAFFFYRGIQAPGVTVVTFAVCGVLTLLFWTLFEYTMHRVLFHYKATSTAGQWLIYLFHGVHHEDPQDPSRLVMPPVVSGVLGVIFYFVFNGVMGDWGELTFAFFALGYLIYDYTHYAVHHFTPRTPIGRFLKQHHMLHHYAGTEDRWGVSSPLWDWILGTAGKPSAR